MNETSATAPVLRVRDLQAHFKTRHFGVHRTVQAVDGITFEVRRNEIYGLAGESSSGKTTLVKTIAGVVKPPLEMVGGTIQFAFMPGRDAVHLAPPDEIARIRWRHLSYIMQGSMNVLNPLRRIRATFGDFDLQLCQGFLGFGNNGMIAFKFTKPDQAHIVFDGLLEAQDGGNAGVQILALAHHLLGFLRIAPEIGVFGLGVQLGELANG